MPSQYDRYFLKSTRTNDSGRMQIPCAGSDCEIIRLHDGAEEIRVDWIVSRTGAVPQVPHYSDINSNLVYLRGEVGAELPGNDGEGLPVWTISGVYWYAVRTAQGLAAELPTAFRNPVPESVFDRSVMANTGPDLPNLVRNPNI